MKEVTEEKILYPEQWCNIERLIEELTKIRAMHNGHIGVRVFGGERGFVGKIALSWTRPLTEEEIKAKEDRDANFAQQAKDMRRKQWEKLNEEFGNESSSST